jgi:hypothetical protein
MVTKKVEIPAEVVEKPVRKPRKPRVNPEAALKEAYGNRKRMTRAEAICAHCRECFNYQPKLVRGCTAEHCALWPFRLIGKEIPTSVPIFK